MRLRPTISAVDFKLRLFIDTNVLIDYLENFDGSKAKTFLELFNKSNFENIELVTSDYVLWELYDYFRKDLYAKKMMCKMGWGFNRTRKGMREFKKATQANMNEFGEKIKEMVEKLEGEKVVYIYRIINKEIEGFSETMEKLLQFSKFELKDALILSSALSNQINAHRIITKDEQFGKEGSRITKLEEEKESLPKEFLERSGIADLEFKKPEEFASETDIKKNYKEWFEKYNEGKQIGKVIKYWSRDRKVIGIECFDDYTLKIGDYIYLVKFHGNNEAFIKLFLIEKDCIKDYESGKSVDEGKKVTIKLSEDFNSENINLEGSLVFLSEE